jgi:hypothetical protein
VKEINKKKWFKNLLKFVAPTMALFFGQLAVGVDWKPASGVALLAFYQGLSDYLSKLK